MLGLEKYLNTAVQDCAEPQEPFREGHQQDEAHNRDIYFLQWKIGSAEDQILQRRGVPVGFHHPKTNLRP